jgi:hypothetical protein
MGVMKNKMNIYLVQRQDTKEYFRPAKGPTWKRRSQWTKDMENAKIYGNAKLARAARTQVIGDFGVRYDGDIRVGLSPQIKILGYAVLAGPWEA